MPGAHQTLGLSLDADAAMVRRRYLELVRQFPPEQAPERFAEVRRAYEQLRDPYQRLETQLLGLAIDDSLDAIVADVKARLRERRIPLDTLLSLAQR